MLVFKLPASHFMGADVTYRCLGNGIYRIFIKAYGDCSSTVGVDGLPIDNGTAFGGTSLNFSLVGTGSNCGSPVRIGNWQLVSYQEVTPLNPACTTATKCTNQSSPINGVREAIFYADYNFSGLNCTVYTIQINQCCRNNAITNITQPGDRYMYLGSATINLAFNPCNSSPQFNFPPVPYMCLGYPQTFNQGAIDLDGDSLSFRLGPCRGGIRNLFGNTPPATIAQNVTYAAGFSATNPITSVPPMTVDALTGDVTITPTVLQTAVMCLYVDEFRNGVQIGTIVRDIQVTVIDCGNNVPPTIPSYTGPNGVRTSFVDTVCAGTQVNYT
ncbi:MAG: hypothetical protein NZ108_10465, partial [Bacteroidia bacterium]|nr:hypothetical protein [Bacteroidia bacterium]